MNLLKKIESIKMDVAGRVDDVAKARIILRAERAKRILLGEGRHQTTPSYWAQLMARVFEEVNKKDAESYIRETIGKGPRTIREGLDLGDENESAS